MSTGVSLFHGVSDCTGRIVSITHYKNTKRQILYFMFQHKRRASSKLLLVREESFATFGYVASYSEKIEETSFLATEDRAPQISTTHKFSISSSKTRGEPCNLKRIQREALHLIFGKKRAYSNVVRKTRAPSQNSRQAPPTSRERRGLRLPLSRQKHTSCLKLLTFSSSACAQEARKDGAPQTDKKEKSGPGPPPSPAFKHRKYLVLGLMVTVQYTIRSFFVLDKGDLLKNILAQVSLHKVWMMM